MENFVVSARKYRPDSFETVVGQGSITRTLKNAVRIGQIAHSYLFCGPRGVGKTTCARIFAKTINCTSPGPEGEACDNCESCRSFRENRSFSIHEMDAASNNGVEDIKNLIDQIRVPPQVGKYSIYIIDEVHMLSSQAFNAFLKTLEEPPSHAVFILATTEKQKIIPTILSRCQIFDFKRITVREMMVHLAGVAEKEGVRIDDTSLNIIAQKADGSMRDALSVFDQVVSFCGTDVEYHSVIENLNVLDYEYYFRMTQALLDGDYARVLTIFDEVLSNGFDSRNYLNGLGKHFRNTLMAKDNETIPLMELSGEVAKQYRDYAGKCSVDFLFGALDTIGTSDVNFKQAKDPRLHMEITLLKITALGRKSEKEEEKETPPKPATPPTPPKPATPPTPSKPATPSTPSPPSPPERSIKTGPRIRDFINQGNSGEKKDEEEKKEDEEVLAEKLDLNQENLNKLWDDFANKIREDQPRLYNTLTTQKPLLLEGSMIRLDLNNPLQEKSLNSIHNEIVAFLKKRTGNMEVQLETNVANEKTEKKLYTQEEKFKHLQDKNPQLGLFKNTLNLDFD